jgi:predicted acylesterase/phospholipase RssA
VHSGKQLLYLRSAPIGPAAWRPWLADRESIRGKWSGIAAPSRDRRLGNGALRYVTNQGELLERDLRTSALLHPGDRVDLITGILAASAIPLIFNPQRMAGETYVDGGVREVIPVQAAIDLGCDLLYVISASVVGVEAAGSFERANGLSIVYRSLVESCLMKWKSEISTRRARRQRTRRTCVPRSRYDRDRSGSYRHQHGLWLHDGGRRSPRSQVNRQLSEAILGFDVRRGITSRLWCRVESAEPA